MFWNKKSGGEGGLPDLPNSPRAAPSMADYRRPAQQMQTPPAQPQQTMSESEEEIHSLPSFPDSPMQKGFSQTMIKDAVETEDIKEENQLPALPQEKEADHMTPPMNKPRVVEMQEWKPQSETAIPQPPASVPKQSSNRPVFVRLDKFKAARESLNTVREKLGEIDELLRTIREVKMKEDHELSSWEKEIESIKARIGHVNSEIFDNAI